MLDHKYFIIPIFLSNKWNLKSRNGPLNFIGNHLSFTLTGAPLQMSGHAHVKWTLSQLKS